MNTAIKTSSIYQRLDFLYYSLTSVFPSVTSPISSGYMLKAMLAETSYIYNEICSLRDKWKELLPFDEDDSQQIKWKHWSDHLKSEKIANYMRIHTPYTFEYVDMNEDDEKIVGSKAKMLEELYKKLDKLSIALRHVGFIVRAALPESIINLYEELKKRCEYEYLLHTNCDLSTMTPDILKDYKEQLHDLVLENFIKVENRQEAQKIWNEMVNQHGVPNILSVGRYIYNNRFQLETYDLREYFEYVRVIDFLQASQSNEIFQPETALTPEVTSEEKQVTAICQPQINTEHLKEIIRSHFIPAMKRKNQWLCVWRVLKDTDIFNKGVTIEQFTKLMTYWFPTQFSKEDLHVYGSTYLGKIRREKWEKKKYEEDIKSHKKASPKAFNTFNALCAEFEEILRDENLREK